MMFTDIHSHILPGIDDGPETMAGSMNMLRMASHQRTTTIYATPHCFLTTPPKKEDIEQGVKELIEESDGDIKIEYGCELMIEDTLPEFIEQNSWMCLGDSRKVLVELPLFNYPIYVTEVLFDMNQRGYRPILAHPERYIAAQKDMDRFLEDIADYADFQINTGSLSGMYGSKAKKTAKELIKRDRVTYIASDAHDHKAYGTIAKAYDIFQRLKGKEEADKVFFYNPLLVNGG